MRFIDWLSAESTALTQLDRMERGEIPCGPVTFTKRDGSTFAEFIEFVKRDDRGEHHLIANRGGLDLFEKHQVEALDVGQIVEAVNDALATVTDLSKRVDALSAAQADLVEVDAAAIVDAFTAAADEALQ